MSLFKSIATFGGFTLISRITGFIRDMVLANYLGAGLVSDAFFVSFKLPNLFRNLFAEGAFTSAFVPILSQKIVGNGKKDALIFASKAISVLVFFVAILVILMEIFMPFIVSTLAPGFANDHGKIELAISLSRITFPFLLFISIVSFQSGILNSFGKFAAPASAPIILNIIMILSVFIFLPFGSTPAHGVAIGVSFAGFIEILWLTYFLRKDNIHLRPRFDVFNILKDKDIKTLFKRIAPGVLGSGIYQINMVVDTIIVSLVGTGAISWLYYANRLQQLPLGVVGAAISVALLPILSCQLKEDKIEEAKRSQDNAIFFGAMLSIPAMVVLIVLATPIINILFQRGKFGEFETIMTAKAVIVYALSLPVYVMVKALTPNFFARGNTKTPVKYSLVVFTCNITLALLLMGPLGHVGVAAAGSISAFVSLFQYVRGLKKRGHWSFSKDLINKIIKISLSSAVMGAAILLAQYAINLRYTNWLNNPMLLKIIILGFLCFIGLVSFVIGAKITGVLDLRQIKSLILRKRSEKC